MSDKCTDESAGRMLHAYELGMLSEKESEGFIAHCLICEYCRQQLEEFRTAARVLMTDDEVLDIIADDHRAQEQAGVSRRRFLGYLWPDFPLLLRPGILMLVLALLIYPAYLGLTGHRESAISRLQAIELAPQRSPEVVKLEASATDVVLSFVFPGAREDGSYLLILVYQDAVLFRDSGYSGFDGFGVGHLLLPSNLMQPGSYSLTITDNSPATGSSVEYRFSVVLPK